MAVVTEAGSHLLYMRFQDALDELDGFGGIRIHRSHWVVRDVVVGHKSQNGRLVLVLSDGSELPVSRKFQPEVKKAGLV